MALSVWAFDTDVTVFSRRSTLDCPKLRVWLTSNETTALKRPAICTPPRVSHERNRTRTPRHRIAGLEGCAPCAATTAASALAERAVAVPALLA